MKCLFLRLRRRRQDVAQAQIASAHLRNRHVERECLLVPARRVGVCSIMKSCFGRCGGTDGRERLNTVWTIPSSRCDLEHRHTSRVARSEHVHGKIEPRFILVMRGAAEMDVRCRGLATSRVRNHVMKLQEAGLAAPAVGPDESTAACIARPYRASHAGWNMTRRRI
jgi:hypothetical protein